MRIGALVVIIAMCPLFCCAQGYLASIQKMPDGSIRLVQSNDQQRVIPAENEQTDVSDVRLSADRRFAGWFVLRDECCQSYPIPMELRLFDGHTTRSVSDGLMQYRWCFIRGRDEVAVASGRTHGDSGETRTRYNVHTGKKLAEWLWNSNVKTPAWSSCLGTISYK